MVRSEGGERSSVSLSIKAVVRSTGWNNICDGTRAPPRQGRASRAQHLTVNIICCNARCKTLWQIQTGPDRSDSIVLKALRLPTAPPALPGPESKKAYEVSLLEAASGFCRSGWMSTRNPDRTSRRRLGARNWAQVISCGNVRIIAVALDMPE
jgi:hypothetical protein